MSKVQAPAQSTDSRQPAAAPRQSAGTELAHTDDRPEAAAQRELAAVIETSPLVLQQKSLFDSVRSSSLTLQKRQLMDQIPNSPRVRQQHAFVDSLAEPHPKPNNTGLLGRLKSGIESLSGVLPDNVEVHYNSSQPAQLNAQAYAQGNEIHVAPAQEQHLPDEPRRVAQQAQGRVKPTLRVSKQSEDSDFSGKGGVSVNTAAVQGAIVQRVKIGQFDITKASPIAEIEEALCWSKHFGLSAHLTAEQLNDLLDELKEREDCGDITQEIRDRLDSDDDGDSVSWDNDEEGFDTGEELDTKEKFISKEERDELRRAKANAFGWKEFPEVIRGFRKIGVHETTAENVRSLVQAGPLSAKVDSGHGIGKGRGFYVTHVGEKTLYNAVKAIAYEDNFVAIYVPTAMQRLQSPDEESNNVAELDRIYGEQMCYYVMSGGTEVLIPERCFHLVKAVATIEDLEGLQ
jgi:hypothetical protein